MSHENTLVGKSILGRGRSEAGAFLACRRNCKKASVAGGESSGREISFLKRPPILLN